MFFFINFFIDEEMNGNLIKMLTIPETATAPLFRPSSYQP